VDLVCACAPRIVEPDTAFRMPGLKFGWALSIRRFANRVGQERACLILQGALTFTAMEGLDMGFCEKLLTQDQWASGVEAIAATAGTFSGKANAALYRCATSDTRVAAVVELPAVGKHSGA